MKQAKWMITLGAVMLIAVFVVGSVHTASAQGPDRAGRGGPRVQLARAVFKAVEDATGLTRREIRIQLRDGKTLSQIVTENGGDPQAVIDTVKAEANQKIDQALSNGKITAAQAEDARSKLDPALDKLMNGQLPSQGSLLRNRVQARIKNSLVGVIADMAGIQPRDVVQEWRSGSSLTQIAEAHGLTADAVVTEAETRITTEVNQAVTDGKITQDQADKLLNGLHDRLERRMTIPGGRPMGV